MPDTESFEMKFGRIAERQLREQTQALVPFKVGFQLLDKTDNNDRAFGVYAFIINDVWAYMPVIYHNGNLYGMDMLYLKTPNIVVPATDSWINVLKEEGRQSMGRPYTKADEKTEDVAYAEDMDTDMDSFPYAFKTASLDPESLISPKTLRRMLQIGLWDMDLLGKTASLGEDASLVLGRTLMSNPEYLNSVFRFYTPEVLQKFAAMAGETYADFANDSGETSAEPSTPGTVDTEPIDPDKVVFIEGPGSDEAKQLTEAEKRVLLRTGVFVKDEREDRSQVFYGTVHDKVHQTPNEPGLYRLLMADGSYRAALIIPLRPELDSPRDAAVVDLQDPKGYYRFPLNHLLATRINTMQDLPLTETGKQVFGTDATRSKLDDILSEDYSRNVLLIRGSGESLELDVSVPWDSTNQKRDPSNATFREIGAKQRPSRVRENSSKMEMPGLDNSNKQLVFTGKPDGKLSSDSASVYIPSDTRMFVQHSYNDRDAFRPGTLDTLQEQLISRHQLAPLSVMEKEGEFSLKGSRGRWTPFMSEVAALRNLVVTRGIFAGQAKQILKEAERSHIPLQLLMKYAAGYGEVEGNPEMRTGSPVARQATTTITEKAAPKVMPQDAINIASRAAESGNKDLFDVASLNGLIRASDPENLKRENLVPLIRAMDATGRLRILLARRRTLFEDRYGRDGLTELEDALKDLFRQEGEVILFLKQKKLYQGQGTETILGSLTQDVGSSD